VIGRYQWKRSHRILICRWKNNITWIVDKSDMKLWTAFRWFTVGFNGRPYIRAGSFLTSQVTIAFSMKTLHLVVI
jgi:hypothetical protein